MVWGYGSVSSNVRDENVYNMIKDLIKNKIYGDFTVITYISVFFLSVILFITNYDGGYIQCDAPRA
jgi:predicted transcriptional regulator